MQLAVNTIIFVVLFALAAMPIRLQKAINRVFKQFGLVTNCLGADFSERLPEDITACPADLNETRPTSHGELLTRFVLQRIRLRLHMLTWRAEMKSKPNSRTVLGKHSRIRISSTNCWPTGPAPRHSLAYMQQWATEQATIAMCSWNRTIHRSHVMCAK